MENANVKPELPTFQSNPVYANNSLLEPSVWDLKIHFGQLEQQSGQATVDWHTSVTVPWAQAKILAYFLMLNIACQEVQAGEKIRVHPSVLPSPLPPPEGTDPAARQLYERSVEIHKTFFGGD